MNKKPSPVAPASPEPVVDPLVCREFPLGSDEIVTLSLWSEAGLSRWPGQDKQTLVQKDYATATKITVQLFAKNLAGPMPATFSINFQGISKSWEGFLEKTNMKSLGGFGDVANFVIDSGKTSPSINLCQERFFGKGVVETSLTTIHGVPTQLDLGTDWLCIDNPLDFEVEYGGRKLEVSGAKALSQGGLVAEPVLVGTPLQVTVVKMPEFLKTTKIQWSLASEKAEGQKLLNWKDLVEGDSLCYEGYKLGLTLMGDLNTAMSTKFNSFDVRVAFHVPDPKNAAKFVTLADIPVATSIPKPLVKEFSWQDAEAEAHRVQMFHYRYPKEFWGKLENSSWVSPSVWTMTSGQNESFLKGKSITANGVRNANVVFHLERVFPGAKIGFTAYVGYTQVPAEGDKDTHWLGVLKGGTVVPSRADPKAIRIVGSEELTRFPVDLAGLAPIGPDGSVYLGPIKNIFMVLAFPQLDGKGALREIPFRHLLDLLPSAQQGVVKISDDRARVEDSEIPLALGSAALTGDGSLDQVFKADKVKWDDVFRPKPLVIIKSGDIELVKMECTLETYAGWMLPSSQTEADVKKGEIPTDGAWRKSTLPEVIKALDPYEGGDPKGEIPHKLQFAKLKVKYRIDVKALEAFYREHGMNMARSPEEKIKKRGESFLKIMPDLAGLIVDAAYENAVCPLYCASHACTEFSAPSMGMEEEGKTYYNFFGINVTSAGQKGVDLGRKWAKEHGWDSEVKGMRGGIEYVSGWLYDTTTGRENLYDMRWDLKAHSKVYGTGVEWAIVASKFMRNICGRLPEQPKFELLVPEFKKK
jgi:beta-N-acetylglucosaminidase